MACASLANLMKGLEMREKRSKSKPKSREYPAARMCTAIPVMFRAIAEYLKT